MKVPRYIVLITRGGGTEGYPAASQASLRTLMRACQKQGFRTKVLRWDAKYKGYLS